MSDHETHNRIVPELFRRLIKETADEDECMVALESVVLGVMKFYRPNPKQAAEYLDIMTMAVIERMGTP